MRMMKPLLLLILIFCNCLPFIRVEPYKELKPLVKAELWQPLIENLNEAGEASDELVEAIRQSPDYMRDAVVFLIAYMPRVDLAKITKEYILENVRLAYQARERFAWGHTYSDELFFHYVLPHRVSQEPLGRWRQFLFDKLAPLVDTLSSASEAALLVNRWCGERVKFKQTQREDQGVIETLKSGYGRCEEMMIVYVSSLRAVGIPSREAWTPYWATGDNNHAWTELWADGSWHYTGSCEPRPTLDDAWFNKSAKRAAVILSSCYGRLEDSDELVYKTRKRYTLINSTPNYSEPCSLTVNLLDGAEPAESISVYISVFNWGALRAILGKKTDSSGKVVFYLNPGTYFVSAGDTIRKAFEIVELWEDRTITIRLLEKTTPRRAFWMRYKAIEEL